jgi:hypothetical protein
MAIIFPGTMREFVDRYIRPSMNDDDIKLAASQFCYNKTPPLERREIYEGICNGLRKYNMAMGQKIQEEYWNKYENIRKLDLNIRRDADAELRHMLNEGNVYRVMMMRNYYKNFDSIIWYRGPIEWQDFEKMADYETEKAIGKAHFRILEDWREYRREPGPKNIG